MDALVNDLELFLLEGCELHASLEDEATRAAVFVLADIFWGRKEEEGLLWNEGILTHYFSILTLNFQYQNTKDMIRKL